MGEKKFIVKDYLSKYFEFTETPEEKQNVRCKLKGCEGKLFVYNSSQGWKSHERHLSTIHNITIDSDIKKKSQSNSLENYGFGNSNVSKFSNRGSYTRQDYRQIRFETDLLDLICVAGLPWNITSNPVFARFVKNIDKNYRIPSPQTLKRRVAKKEGKYQTDFKKCLAQIPSSTLHMSLDHCSTRDGNSVIGIRTHFIDENWKLMNFTLGFAEFDVRKTANNVKEVFKECVSSMGITPEQLGIISSDNASEMQAAFQLDYFRTSDTVVEDVSLEDTDEDEDDDINWIEDFEVEDLEGGEGNTSVNFVNPSSTTGGSTDDEPCEDVFEAIVDWGKTTLERRGCCAHTLHLVVTECISKNPAAQDLVKFLAKLVSFFSNSNYWSMKLYKRTKKRLIKLGQTRWNCILHALRRLLTKDFIKNVNAVLEEARRKDAKALKSWPGLISESMEVQMMELRNLLTPFLDLTNSLQADGVTSSKVIPGVIGLYNEIAAVSCTHDYMSALRSSLCLAISERFGADGAHVESTNLDPYLSYGFQFLLKYFQDYLGPPISLSASQQLFLQRFHVFGY